MMELTALKLLGIDAAEGLACCADDMEFYEEMLAEYARESEANQERLQHFFDERDWPNYRIRIHSLKSTSRMIGAEAIAEHAYLLEVASKEQDSEAILKSHASFLADYSSLTDRLKEMIG